MESLYQQEPTTVKQVQTQPNTPIKSIQSYKPFTNLSNYVLKAKYKNKFITALTESGNNFRLALIKYSTMLRAELTYSDWFKLSGQGISLNHKLFPYKTSMRPLKRLIELFKSQPEHIEWLVTKLVTQDHNNSPILVKNCENILTAMICYEEQLRSGNKKKGVKKIDSIDDIKQNIDARFGAD
jgi:hypothetical protein